MKNIELAKTILSGAVDSYASVILGIAVNQFGIECLEWEASTFDIEVSHKFGIKLGRIPKNRLLAAITSLTSDSWLNDPFVFNQVANAFGDGTVSMEVFEPADPQEIGWTLVEYSILDKPEPMDPDGESVENQLAQEVKAYIGATLKDYSIRPNGIFEFLADVYDIDYTQWAEDTDMAQTMFKESDGALGDVMAYIQDNLSKLRGQVEALQLPKNV